MPRSSEKTIGTTDRTSPATISLRHRPRSAAATAAKATKVSAAMFPPQSFV